MNTGTHYRASGILVTVVIVLASTTTVRAQEAELVTAIGKQIVKVFGKEVAEVGGEVVARQATKQLVMEAAESAGPAGRRIAQAQVERILATRQRQSIGDLKSISGRSLLLLEGTADDALPSALEILAKDGLATAIQALPSPSLQKAALAAEMRLPGAGLKLVQHYGAEGAELSAKLTEDQANSVVQALRPNAVNALPPAERSRMLNALIGKPESHLLNLEGITGPLVVVVSGIVTWHGIDVTLAPNERVTELPNGTVVREKTSVGSRAVETLPVAMRELSGSVKWTGISLAVVGLLLWRLRSFTRRRHSNGLIPSPVS